MLFTPLGITAAMGRDCVYGSSWTPPTIGMTLFTLELSDACDVAPVTGLTDRTLDVSMNRAVGAVCGTNDRLRSCTSGIEYGTPGIAM